VAGRIAGNERGEYHPAIHYGEHWFDNWDERGVLEQRARELGIDPYDLMVINPDRLANDSDGPCHSRKQRKLFWTDVLKSLELSHELLFEEARSQNAGAKEMREKYQFGDDYIEDLEERIRRLQEGWKPLPGDEG
jgi:hypothetical protein